MDPTETLTGTWRFERRLEDRLDGVNGSATGVADFEPCPEGLRWSESGMLEFAGFRGPVTREMMIVKAGDGWEVRFDDGRLFHPLNLHRGGCSVTHPCRADMYDGDIRVHDTDHGPELSTEWRVKGPAKDQLIVTRYRRPSSWPRRSSRAGTA